MFSFEFSCLTPRVVTLCYVYGSVHLFLKHSCVSKCVTGVCDRTEVAAYIAACLTNLSIGAARSAPVVGLRVNVHQDKMLFVQMLKEGI